MAKRDIYEAELEKLTELFKDVEPSKAQLVEGLIQEAAFLRAENSSLREAIAPTGMVKVHPLHPEIQKPVEAAKQYLKNINSYAVVIKALNSVLSKGVIEEEDDMSEFE